MSFNPETQVAYCKYCYRTHDDWAPATDHDGDCWTCELCDHTSKEDYMKIFRLEESQ